uniref:Tc1-like transposase DDE domain-containing protein n=1 Tax=Amphiprion percula TaxID=161767 RepID=A0A3P8SHT6_AMPPE
LRNFEYKILWSDESSFQLYLPPANHVQYLIMKHVGGSIMVWGCMTAAVVGHLTVCEDTLNSAKYCPNWTCIIFMSYWPAQSPDMSSIRKPKSLEELKAVIQEEWDNITP